MPIEFLKQVYFDVVDRPQWVPAQTFNRAEFMSLVVLSIAVGVYGYLLKTSKKPPTLFELFIFCGWMFVIPYVVWVTYAG
jgi:hypothetical protein